MHIIGSNRFDSSGMCPYDAAPMSNQLLDHVLPHKLAERGQVIDCKVEIRDLGRLAGIVESDLAALPVGERPANWRRSPVSIRLSFGFAEASAAVPMVKGEVSTTMEAVCQRCLQACSLPLKATIEYLLVPYKDQAAKYNEYEIWELTEKTLLPMDIVEEVLLMAMPFPALHELTDQCGKLAQEFMPEPADTARPFAGLKAQLDEIN